VTTSAKRKLPPSRVGELRSLAGDPRAQAALALELLESPGALLDVLAALKVLGADPAPRYRLPLLQLYAYCAGNASRRDPGGTIRRQVLAALRPIATAEDTPLLEEAATALEWLPPGPSEVAAPLRAAALLALDAADPPVAVAHAVRLLYDAHQDHMTGEPALSAVRVLAAEDQTAALYGYLLAGAARTPEVAAEALRSLDSLPLRPLQEVVERTMARGNPGEMVGLFELIVAHPARAAFVDHLAEFLAGDGDIDLYAFLVTLLFTCRHAPLLDLAFVHAAGERRPERAAILADALQHRGGDPRTAEIRDRLTALVEHR
jgi:hypothetical protein